MDDEFKDYFDSDSVPEEKPKEETPEQREERELRETTIDRRRNKRRIFLLCLIIVLLGFIAYTVWSHYFHPYTSTDVKGVIVDVFNKGSLVKTYECEMISEKFITDTTHVYQADFSFTIPNDSLARTANGLKGTGRRVVVTYDEYKGNLPWRGETNRYATKIEVDTTAIR